MKTEVLFPCQQELNSERYNDDCDPQPSLCSPFL